MEQTVYQQYLSLLRQELIPAMGCTEPIALAYCAAATWDAAGGGGPELADRVEVTVSGNIIKNVKSVIVPNTGGLRGIETAVAAGLVSGRREKRLEVLAALEPEHHDQIRTLLDRRIIRVLPAQNDELLYIEIRLWRADGVTARGILQGNHTNLTLLERDGVPLLQADRQEGQTKRTLQLSVQEIFEFAQEADPRDLEPLTGRRGDGGLLGSQRRQNPSPGLRGGRPFPGPGLCSRRVRRQNERL